LVIEVVKGGLIVDIGLRGFLPASLVELRRVRDLQPYMGQKLEAKIIELDKNRNNVVLSRRAWLEETQKEQREEFLDNLKPGERRTGVVSSVVNFGAFVDLGGMDGLVHVSELSWKHVDHPGSVVTVGDEIEVEVLEVDLDRERISLSLKATQQDPWQEFANEHRVGELVYGRVTKLVPFGSFVQVGDGIEGLVHISEMSAHHVEMPEPRAGAFRPSTRSTSASTPMTTRATTSVRQVNTPHPTPRRRGPSTTPSTATAPRRARPRAAQRPRQRRPLRIRPWPRMLRLQRMHPSQRIQRSSSRHPWPPRPTPRSPPKPKPDHLGREAHC
jgi:predicted RNA-binding protein with RPS1 domain